MPDNLIWVCHLFPYNSAHLNVKCHITCAGVHRHYSELNTNLSHGSQTSYFSLGTVANIMWSLIQQSEEVILYK